MNKRISLVAAALLIFPRLHWSRHRYRRRRKQRRPVTKTVQNRTGLTPLSVSAKERNHRHFNSSWANGSKGVATILRDDNGTRVVLNLTGCPPTSRHKCVCYGRHRSNYAAWTSSALQ